MRNVFNKALSPQRVAALGLKVRAIADELIDGFADDGEVELLPLVWDAAPRETLA